MENHRGVEIIQVNILYFITAMFLLSIGYYVQHQNLKVGLLITEYIIILLPPLIYIKMKNDSFQKVLRLNTLRFKHVGMVILMSIFMYPVAIFVNLIFITFLTFFGDIKPQTIPTANNPFEYIVLLFIISISAGICEEVFFRGLLLKTYEEIGKNKAIWISALLFGVFHFNLQNFFGPIIIGLFLGNLVYKTNSLWAGIIGHMTNNGLAVTIGYIINLYNKGAKQTADSISYLGTFQIVMFDIFMGIVSILAGTLCYIFYKWMIQDLKKHQQEYYFIKNQEKIKTMSKFVFTPIWLTVIIFIYMGYLQIKHIML